MIKPQMEEIDIKESTSFNGLGIDSMEAQRLRNLLASNLPTFAPTENFESLPVNVVLEAHSVGNLASVMRRRSIVDDEEETKLVNKATEAKTPSNVMTALKEKYSQQIQPRQSSASSSAHLASLAGSTVLLTGSTGFLGSNVVKSLQDCKVKKIYALIRAKSRTEAQIRLSDALQKKESLNSLTMNRKIA